MINKYIHVLIEPLIWSACFNADIAAQLFSHASETVGCQPSYPQFIKILVASTENSRIDTLHLVTMVSLILYSYCIQLQLEPPNEQIGMQHLCIPSMLAMENLTFCFFKL